MEYRKYRGGEYKASDGILLRSVKMTKDDVFFVEASCVIEDLKNSYSA